MRAAAWRMLVCSLGLCTLMGCGDSSEPTSAATTTDAGQADAAPALDAATAACTRSEGCVDLDTPFFNYASCCTAKYACGYELTYTEEFAQVYPQIVELQKQLAHDDPNGKCVPESFVFPMKEGTYDHRVETEGAPEKDVIVAAQCESRGFSVFAMPGCCMPNNQCGISTDEIMFTFQVLLEGDEEPFSEPECLTADELNAQLRESRLSAFARIPPTAGASCDYAALSEQLPRFRN